MSDKALKQGSDALFLLTVVLVVVAFAADLQALLAVAAVTLVGSVVLTSKKRRRAKARKDAKASPRG